MNKDIYIQEIFEIISDCTKFIDLSTDPTITREGQLQRFLGFMNGKQIFSEETYEKIYPSGSSKPFIYVTPEIHKLKHNIIKDLSLSLIICSMAGVDSEILKREGALC